MKWPGQRPSNIVNQAVTFPNVSRSYDATRRAVAFWGYDRSMENSFFVTWDALKRIQPNLEADEAGLLRAFDSNRKLIYEIAAKVYGRGRKSVYNLVAADF
ncbi:MAG: DUF1488 domain-containing protein [Betaproteobacteria bacterium]|nr:DUF1488 domain-containing protein [Betaproteobacteria bacterium]